MEKNVERFYAGKAKIEDIEDVRNMIQELSDFQGMSNGPKLSTQDLIKDSGLNGQHSFFHCYILKVKEYSKNDSSSSESQYLSCKNIGFSICFPTYSTWEGKSYFIEDIYVKPEYRKQGAGKLLLKYIVNEANENDCIRIDFHVLDWNPAKEFYEKFCAINLTKLEKWNLYRFEKEQIDKILKS